MDVSDRIAFGLVEIMEAMGHDIDAAFVGMPFTRADLSQWSRRLVWEDYLEVWERVTAIVGRDEMLRGMQRYDQHIPELQAIVANVISPAQFARIHCMLSAA